MKENPDHVQRHETPEIQPFNSVTDHYRKIVGMLTRPADNVELFVSEITTLKMSSDT